MGGHGTIVESGDELALFWLRNADSPYSVSVWSTEYSVQYGLWRARLDFILKIPEQKQWVLGPEAGYEAEDEDTSAKKVKDAMAGNQQRGFRRGLETGTRLMRIVSMLSRRTNCERLDCKPNTGRSVSYNNSGNPGNWSRHCSCYADICFER